MSTLMLIAAAIALIGGFSIIRKILIELGLFQSQEGQEYDENVSSPKSFWNPLFWQQGPVGTFLITHAGCTWLYNEIYDSFGVLGDDEARIFAAFKTLKTQSQLSYFSDWVQRNKGKDLLKWLKGTDWGPVGDHLSVAEIAVITDYVKKLPKYKV